MKNHEHFTSLFQENVFPGLITMMKSYLDSIDVDVDTGCTISQYLSLIGKRASGR